MFLIIFALAATLLLLALLVRLIRRERRARQRLEIHGQLFDKLADGVLLIDRAGIIRQHNLAASQLLDKAGDELLGLRLTDCLPELNAVEPLGTTPGRQIVSVSGSRLPLEVSCLGAGHADRPRR